MNPTVSIITPTYNHQEFIATCIESVLRQTYNNWEMIIIDDGSTDETEKIIKGFSDQRIRYVYQEHIGVYRLGEIYNRALALSKGKFIAILEGDDYWPDYKLEYQIPLFDEPQVILSYGDWLTVNERNKIAKKYRPCLTVPDKNTRENRPIGISLKIFLKAVPFFRAVTVCIRKDALTKIGGFIPSSHIPAVDSPTFCTLALEGEFRYLPKPLGYWRRHPKSTTFVELFNFRNASFFIDFVTKNQGKIKKLKIDINIPQVIESLKYLEDEFNFSKEYWKAMAHLELGENYLARKYLIQYLKKHQKRFTYNIKSFIGVLSSYAGLNLIHLISFIKRFFRHKFR